MKLAMNQIAAQLQADGYQSRMLLQVHDELVFEVASGELEKLTAMVTQKMANVVELSVPLEVQVGTGQNWDTAGH
jgi:DNA polymerase-1